MTSPLRDAGLLPPLFHVEGDLVEKFNRALMHVTGLETKQTEFFVDSRGRSPQLISELGTKYLQVGAAHRYLIVVSPSQGDAGLLDPEFSFDSSLIAQLYADHQNGVSIVTRVDGLYAEIEDGIGTYEQLPDLLGVKWLKTQLHTPSGFIHKSRQLKDLVEKLEDDPELLVQDDSRALRGIHALVREVGDVRDYPITRMVATQDVGSYWTTLFDGVYVFRGSEPKRKSNRIKRPGSTTSTFAQRRPDQPTTVLHGGRRLEDTPLTTYLSLNDHHAIVDFLRRQELVTLDPALIDVRLTRLEDLAILGSGGNLESLRLPQRHLACSKIAPSREHRELQDARRAVASSSHFATDVARRLSPTTLVLLMQPKGTTDVTPLVDHLLWRLWPHDYERTFRTNPWTVEVMMAGTEPSLKQYMLMKLREIDAQRHETEQGREVQERR